MAKKREKGEPVEATDTTPEAAMKPFLFRPLHPRLKAALKAAAEDENGPYYRHSRNDILNLMAEKELRHLGHLGGKKPPHVE